MAQKISSKDHANLPIKRWNVTTFTEFLVSETKRRFNVDYLPGGHGTPSNRWMREKGMLKNAQGKYGNAVLKRFIELALDSYTPTTDYPYVTVTFMLTYRDRLFINAQKAVSDEARARKLAEQHVDITKLSSEEIDDIL